MGLEKEDREISSFTSHITASLVRIISVLKKDSLSKGISVIPCFKSLNSKPTAIPNSECKQRVTQRGLFWTVFLVCLFVLRDWVIKALRQPRVSVPRVCSYPSTLQRLRLLHTRNPEWVEGVHVWTQMLLDIRQYGLSLSSRFESSLLQKASCHLHRRGTLRDGQTEFVLQWQLHQRHITRVKGCRIVDRGMVLSNKSGKSSSSRFPREKRCSGRRTAGAHGSAHSSERKAQTLSCLAVFGRWQSSS